MEILKNWSRSPVLLLLFLCLRFHSCVAQTNLGANGHGRRQNAIELHTCCDLGLDPSRRECPDVLIPLPEFQRLKDWEIPSHLTFSEKRTRATLSRHSLPCSESDRKLREFSLDPNADILPEIQFQPDGYLMIGNRTFADYIHPESYCIEGISPIKLKIRTCETKCTKTEPCIRKCCPMHQIFDMARRCVSQPPPNSQWTPKLFSKPSKLKSQINLATNPEIRPRILLRAPPTFGESCEKSEDGRSILLTMPYSFNLNLTPVDYETHPLNARLGADGRLYSRNEHRKWEALPDEEYCSDGLTILDDTSHVYRDTMDETVYVLCAMREEEEKQASEYYAALAIACSMFALITVIVYFLLLDKQNIHGWTTMSHSTAVFFLFIFLGVAHLTKEHAHLYQTGVCAFVGMMAHYFWMAVFCWLLILSFDLWMTFKSLSVASSRSGCRRFMLYSIFGWGFPFLFVLFSWAMDKFFGPDINSEVVVPMYGDSFCYITRHALLQYLYLPSAILFVINMAFFLLTAWTLHRYQQSTKMATKNMQKNRQSFMLFVKLFIVAGILWIIEIISFLASGAHIPWYVQILDTLTVLQPVFIFIIFVIKWEIINTLHEKYVCLRPIVYPARILLKQFRRKGNPPLTSQVESTALNSRVNDTNISRVSCDTSEIANSAF